jgi:hypothetical protein
MAFSPCDCNGCHKCSLQALIRGLHAAHRTDPDLYDRVIAGQLAFLSSLEGGIGHRLRFFEDLLGYLVFTEQYNLAQHTARKFVIPGARVNTTIVWLIYASFRVDAGAAEHLSNGLPLDIGFGLSELGSCGFCLGDVMELWETPEWINRFDWVILAQNQRGALVRMLQHAAHRLPAHYWAVIKASWILTDAGAEPALRSLRTRVADGYGFAKNATPAGLALAATRNFVDPADLTNPEAYEILENIHAPQTAVAMGPPAPLTEAPCVRPIGPAVEPMSLPPTVWEQAPGAKRGRRRGGRKHKKAKAAASGGAAAGAGGGR